MQLVSDRSGLYLCLLIPWLLADIFFLNLLSLSGKEPDHVLHDTIFLNMLWLDDRDFNVNNPRQEVKRHEFVHQRITWI